VPVTTCQSAQRQCVAVCSSGAVAVCCNVCQLSLVSVPAASVLQCVPKLQGVAVCASRHVSLCRTATSSGCIVASSHFYIRTSCSIIFPCSNCDILSSPSNTCCYIFCLDHVQTRQWPCLSPCLNPCPNKMRRHPLQIRSTSLRCLHFVYRVVPGHKNWQIKTAGWNWTGFFTEGLETRWQRFGQFLNNLNL